MYPFNSKRIQTRTNRFHSFLEFGLFLHETTLFLHLYALSSLSLSLHFFSHLIPIKPSKTCVQQYQKMASPPNLISCNESSDLESIQEIVVSINDYILSVVSNPEVWFSLKQQCISMLSIEEENTLFEFSSEHSALSNLYWGIESIEASLQPESSEEKMSRLRNSERMLQMPALLDEQGTTTSGVPNSTLVAFSYFYLSIVSCIQGDSLQTTLHFLQSVLVSPDVLRNEIAPELCECLFFTPGVSKSDEEIREIARKYKYRATYYQVISYGKNHQRSSECTEKQLQRPNKYRYGF